MQQPHTTLAVPPLPGKMQLWGWGLAPALAAASGKEITAPAAVGMQEMGTGCTSGDTGTAGASRDSPLDSPRQSQPGRSWGRGGNSAFCCVCEGPAAPEVSPPGSQLAGDKAGAVPGHGTVSLSFKICPKPNHSMNAAGEFVVGWREGPAGSRELHQDKPQHSPNVCVLLSLTVPTCMEQGIHQDKPQHGPNVCVLLSLIIPTCCRAGNCSALGGTQGKSGVDKCLKLISNGLESWNSLLAYCKN